MYSLHSSYERNGGNHNNRSNRLVDDDDQQLMSPEHESFPPSAIALPPHSVGLRPVHTRSSSDPTYMSPFSMPPTSLTGDSKSLGVNRSTSLSYASSNKGSSMMVPPAFSIPSSVHFAQSLAPQDNKPGDALTSLNRINNNEDKTSSWARSGESHPCLEGTEPDHKGIGLNSLHRAMSITTKMAATSPTQTYIDELSVQSGKGSRSCSHSREKKGDRDSDGGTAAYETVRWPPGELYPGNPSKNNKEEEAKAMRVELNDSDIDVHPTPSEFKPYMLASMSGRKNSDLLKNMEDSGPNGIVMPSHDAQNSDPLAGEIVSSRCISFLCRKSNDSTLVWMQNATESVSPAFTRSEALPIANVCLAYRCSPPQVLSYCFFSSV